MKAYEVILYVTNGYNGQTKSYFIKAKSIADIKICSDVKKVHYRPDVDIKYCTHEIIMGGIETID